MAKVLADLFNFAHHFADAYLAREPIISTDISLVVNGRDHESNVLWKSGTTCHVGTPGVGGFADEDGRPNLQSSFDDSLPRKLCVFECVPRFVFFQKCRLGHIQRDSNLFEVSPLGQAG